MNTLIQKRFIAGIVGMLCVAGGEAQTQSEPTALIDQQHCMFCHTRDAP